MPVPTLTYLIQRALVLAREDVPGLQENQYKQTLIAAAREQFPGIPVNAALLQYLSGSDPSAAYAAVILADTPQSYWRFGEASGSVAADIGALGNDATYQLGTNPDDVAGWTPRDGIVDGASAITLVTAGRGVALSNVADYAFCGFNTDFSFEFWLKAPASALTEEWFFSTLGGPFTQRLLRGFRADAAFPQIQFERTSPDGLSTATFEIPDAIFDDDWHHLVLTKTGATIRLYVDAALSTSGADAEAAQTAPEAGSWGARNAGGDMLQTFVGALAEVALYDYALSAGQVAAHFAARTV